MLQRFSDRLLCTSWMQISFESNNIREYRKGFEFRYTEEELLTAHKYIPNNILFMLRNRIKRESYLKSL